MDGAVFLYLDRFKRSSDSTGADYLSLDYLSQSSDLGEPRPSCSLCCDIAQILLSWKHPHNNYHLSNRYLGARYTLVNVQLKKHNLQGNFDRIHVPYTHL